jgi:aspartyl-tRNA(Asn)/glutamyl-tRNA(Gln) amidotransferase subunit B
MPAGFGAGGMPVGLQLIGNYFKEGAAAERGPPVPAGDRFPPPQAGGISEPDPTHRQPPQTSLVRATKSSSASRPTPSFPPQSKIFSRAPTAFGAEPNTQASPVDLALPGTLPVMNKGAVERAIRFGLAIGAHVAPRSIFARKNYFYPDLPKGYQISQFEIPVVQGGNVEFYLGEEKKSVRLVRAHLEEDAGKSLHEDFIGQSGIDLNRAGTPLLEIVTEPDMRSPTKRWPMPRSCTRSSPGSASATATCRKAASAATPTCRCASPAQPLGTRREIKNLNSFKFMKEAIDFEVRWQIEQIEDGLAIQQATVLFDPDTGETRAMRTKEDAADYRYFPDPDLPPLVIAPTGWSA